MYKENGNPCQIVRIYDGLIIAKIDGNIDYDEYKQCSIVTGKQIGRAHV